MKRLSSQSTAGGDVDEVVTVTTRTSIRRKSSRKPSVFEMHLRPHYMHFTTMESLISEVAMGWSLCNYRATLMRASSLFALLFMEGVPLLVLA
jgi:hypothetical protein